MNATERKRELALAAAGSHFPALGVLAADGEVKTLYRRRNLGPLRGSRAEILPGKRIGRPTLALNQAFTRVPPMSAPYAMITFPDGSYHERKLRSGGGGFTVNGMIRAAQADARRFNLLSDIV